MALNIVVTFGWNHISAGWVILEGMVKAWNQIVLSIYLEKEDRQREVARQSEPLCDLLMQ